MPILLQVQQQQSETPVGRPSSRPELNLEQDTVVAEENYLVVGRPAAEATQRAGAAAVLAANADAADLLGIVGRIILVVEADGRYLVAAFDDAGGKAANGLRNDLIGGELRLGELLLDVDWKATSPSNRGRFL